MATYYMIIYMNCPKKSIYRDGKLNSGCLGLGKQGVPAVGRRALSWEAGNVLILHSGDGCTTL